MKKEIFLLVGVAIVAIGLSGFLMMSVSTPKAHIFIIDRISDKGFEATGISESGGFVTKHFSTIPVEDNYLPISRPVIFGYLDIRSEVRGCYDGGERKSGEVVYPRIRIKTKRENIDIVLPYREVCWGKQKYDIRYYHSKPGGYCVPKGTGDYGGYFYLKDANDDVDFDIVLSGDLRHTEWTCPQQIGGKCPVSRANEVMRLNGDGIGDFSKCVSWEEWKSENYDSLSCRDKGVLDRTGTPFMVCGNKFFFRKSLGGWTTAVSEVDEYLGKVLLIDKENRFVIGLNQNSYLAVRFSKSFIEEECGACDPTDGVPSVCTEECPLPEGYMLAIETFNPGTINIQSTRYPVQDFCLKHPAIITDNKTKQSYTDASIYYKLVDGKSVTIPEGQTLTLFYILKVNEQIPIICSEGYNVNQEKCGISTGVVHICSEGQFDPERGICVIQPETVCEKGYYDVKEKVCVWHPPLQAICEKGIYNPDTGNCEYTPEVEGVCDVGFYDPTKGVCLVKAEKIEYECPEGSTWDSNREACISKQFEVFCQKGEYKDGVCVWQPEEMRIEVGKYDIGEQGLEGLVIILTLLIIILIAIYKLVGR